MCNLSISLHGGGIFSKLMLIIQNIENNNSLDINTIENIYVKNLHDLIDKNINPYDYLFEQIEINPSINIYCNKWKGYTNEIPIEKLERYKIIASKFKINKLLDNKIDVAKKKLNIDENTLGLHLRMTDMNIHHVADYGYKTFEDYINKIDITLNEGHYSKIFVASDNNESIKKLENRYGNKIFYYDQIERSEFENSDSTFQINNFSKEKFWHDSFIDMMLLSECSLLIHRISGLPNAVKIYSHKLKKTIMI